MTTRETELDKKDFFSELMTEIEAGNSRHAVLMITGLPERDSQLDILLRLAHVQALALEKALEKALVVAHDLDHVRDLDLDKASAQALARDLAHEYAHILDHAHDQAVALEKALVRNDTHDLDPVFARARDVDHAFARAREHALYLDRDTHINKTIMNCLNALMYEGKL
jgi:hypothetical protein